MKPTDDQDPVEQLRQLWAQVEPPSPNENADDELHQDAVKWLDSALDAAARETSAATQELDPSTTAAVAWVRCAWSQTQVPAQPSLPVARARHLVAAAAALLIAGLAFTLAPLPSHKLTTARLDSPLIAQAPEPASQPPPARPSIPVRIVPAGIELTSGPVRLTLLAQLTPTTKTQD